MPSRVQQTGPPDDWLALNEAERADVERRAHEYDPETMGALSLQLVHEPPEPQPVADVAPLQSLPPPTLGDAMVVADTLEPDDRMRLIAWLWESLPDRNRAAIIAFGLDNMRYPTDENPDPANEQTVEPLGPKLWELLFDPTKTSELYSAPRRFDLATIFVITAAYSVLFGAMTALDFGPVAEVAIGLLVTIVAVSQAFFQHSANPRGVSVVTGAATLSIILAIIGIAAPRALGVPFFIAFVIYGLMGGAFAGYAAGVLVGGVFLFADYLRKRYTPNADQTRDAHDSDSSEHGDSPWTN